MKETGEKNRGELQKEPYFGSVRFFKNMILLAVIIAIMVPSVMIVVRRGQINKLEEQGEILRQELADVSTQLSELQEEEAKELGVDPIPYQSMYPDFYAPEPLPAPELPEKVIYLTFDDGPSKRTPEILEILREKNVKATFFVIGHTDEQALQWMKDIVAEGHTIAMHTYSHRYTDIYSSVDAFLGDMYKLFVLIRDTTGVEPSIFRFPGGSINGYNKAVYQEIEAEMLRRGFIPYDWNLSSGDASGVKISAEQIVNNVVGTAGKLDYGIVLMHDSEPKVSTVASLVPMIDRLTEMGFTFDKLSSTVKPVLFGYRD